MFSVRSSRPALEFRVLPFFFSIQLDSMTSRGFVREKKWGAISRVASARPSSTGAPRRHLHGRTDKPGMFHVVLPMPSLLLSSNLCFVFSFPLRPCRPHWPPPPFLLHKNTWRAHPSAFLGNWTITTPAATTTTTTRECFYSFSLLSLAFVSFCPDWGLGWQV